MSILKWWLRKEREILVLNNTVIIQLLEAPPSSGRVFSIITTKQTEGWLLRRCLLLICIARGEKTGALPCVVSIFEILVMIIE